MGVCFFSQGWDFERKSLDVMSINILFEQKPIHQRGVNRDAPAIKAYGFLCGSEMIVEDPVSINQLINNVVRIFSKL